MSDRTAMSMDSHEMELRGFQGLATVTRHEGENFIIVGRDAEALRKFWSRWAPDFIPDEAKYKRGVLIHPASLEERKEGAAK